VKSPRFATLGAGVEFGGDEIGIGPLDKLVQAAEDAAAGVVVGDFLEQQAGDYIGKLMQLLWFDVADILFGEALGVRAFEQPGGGTPVRVGGVAHGVERAELGGEVRAAQLLVEVGIAAGFAADRAGGTTDVAGGTSRPQPAEISAEISRSFTLSRARRRPTVGGVLGDEGEFMGR
jgi:hypothetical protein